MNTIVIPYEIIEKTFGKFIADNFNTISAILVIVGFIIATLSNRFGGKNWIQKAQDKQQKRFDYMNDHISEKEPKTKDSNIYQGNRKKGTKWYPSGWTYNEETSLWEPPDYLAKESSEKWRWDPDKRIWIDKEKEARMEKYRKYHEGQPPTFEEWKAQREKEKQEQQK